MVSTWTKLHSGKEHCDLHSVTKSIENYPLQCKHNKSDNSTGSLERELWCCFPGTVNNYMYPYYSWGHLDNNQLCAWIHFGIGSILSCAQIIGSLQQTNSTSSMLLVHYQISIMQSNTYIYCTTLYYCNFHYCKLYNLFSGISMEALGKKN